VNYARLDGFDPAAPQVPVKERPDIDRWILSDLQKLVMTARREFEAFNVMGFCLEAERFVDAKLSNWYVRRNRRRFWKSEASADKRAAYQTLYAVLVTLTRLFAPVMPFLSERMYQNLAAGSGVEGAEKSVHHCAFPLPDEALVDEELSADMEALLDLVSLGSSARNSVKIKMRQPLAELKVQPAGARQRRAVERFKDQMLDELNVKAVTLHDQAAAGGPLLSPEISPNMKTIGPKFGPRLKEVQAAVASVDPAVAAAALEGGGTLSLKLKDGGEVQLAAEDITRRWKAKEGWAGGAGASGLVAFDTRVTPELAAEGVAREVVRHVQELRKNSGLELEDRIELQLRTGSSAVQAALNAHRDYIASETLAVRWGETTPGEGLHEATVKIDGEALTVQLRKA